MAIRECLLDTRTRNTGQRGQEVMSRKKRGTNKMTANQHLSASDLHSKTYLFMLDLNLSGKKIREKKTQ